MEHPAGLREITQVVLFMPLAQPPSEALRYLNDAGLVVLRESERYAMQIEFDGGRQGEERSFAPGLPLVWRW